MSINGRALSQAWNDWQESPEGERCLKFSTLTDGDYLQNRLWSAFMAGAKAAETITQIAEEGAVEESSK